MQLPGVDDWMHTVIPAGGMNHTVNVGDQCTFFVCFKYCKPKSGGSGGCERLHRNLPGRNITICKCMDIWNPFRTIGYPSAD